MIETRLIDLPHGITLSCRTAGTPGRPVLMFLHGFPEAAFVWDGLLAHFARADNGGWYCVAPNLRGFERSSAPDDVNALFARLHEQAMNDLRSDGFAANQIRVERALDLRYAGQGFQVETEIPAAALASADRDTALAEAEDQLKKRGIVHSGDVYAITVGEPMGQAGGTNTLKICQAG